MLKIYFYIQLHTFMHKSMLNIHQYILVMVLSLRNDTINGV
jgi:hypothetical protein